ncbi:histone-fold-containing protein [Microthyrium microscopicum]|uniref:DNA polymerase epsilon subunit D n=1 Tax=Microthyrium microscopicum TaxID=703497 RepID=A0A6A6U583_9PEZI|nr:histone-fold-containing protein [Microthyrium microscopicum]
MPPRKSVGASSTAGPDGESIMDISIASAKDKDSLAVEDLGLPKSMVQRLAKGVLPANTQIQKDAQTAIWKSATVFVSHLASAANENAQHANKKTIQPADVLDALKDLEFPGFIPRLEQELAKYNAIQSSKRNSYRKKIRDSSDVNSKAKEPTDLDNSTTTPPRAASEVNSEMVPDSPNSMASGIPFDAYGGASSSGGGLARSGGGLVNSGLANSGMGPGVPGSASRDEVRVVIPATVSRKAQMEEPAAKRARRDGEDVDMDAEEEEDVEDDVEDDVEEEEDEEEEPEEDDEEAPGPLMEDPLEEIDDEDDEDEAVDGDESD